MNQKEQQRALSAFRAATTAAHRALLPRAGSPFPAARGAVVRQELSFHLDAGSLEEEQQLMQEFVRYYKNAMGGGELKIVGPAISDSDVRPCIWYDLWLDGTEVATFFMHPSKQEMQKLLESQANGKDS